MTEKDKFWVLRGKAIAAYAEVEQSLCSLLSCFGDIKIDVASVIYFSISSPAAVGKILDTLLRKKYGNTYSKFWDSLGNEIIRPLNGKRNDIVHWGVANQIDLTYKTQILTLMPQDFWNRTLYAKPDINAPDLIEFINRCGFVSRLCTMFFLFLHPEMRERWAKDAPDDVDTWREIFGKRAVYPPPNNHPLFPIPLIP
jgi:hypothetical protein